MSGALMVVEHPEDAPDEGDVFVISSELEGVPPTEYEDIFRRVLEGEVESGTDLPLYRVLRISFAFLFAQEPNPPMAIPHLVVLHRLLDDHLAEKDYDEVVCGDVPPDFTAAVTDAAANHDVTVTGAEEFGFRRTALGFLTGLYGYLRLITAQAIAMVWALIDGRPGPTETVIVPHMNRFDSTKPVIDSMKTDHEVVVPTPTVSWLRHRPDRYAEIEAYDPTPLDCFATLGTVVRSLRRAGSLMSEILLRRSFGNRLEGFVANEFGVRMPNTTSYLLGNLLSVHLPSLVNTTLAEQMLAELDPETLVVGSLGSRQQAILHTAIEAGVQTYHVPHSATTGYELTPPLETVHFVPGDHVVDHLAASEQTSYTDHLVPTGRPQLVALQRHDVHPLTPPSDALRVVVATQPFPDRTREQFVSDVLDALEHAPVAVDIVVKIHPNESRSFYQDAVEDRPYPTSIAEEDLHGHLAAADLVVTVNSNVGLESMVLGTPIVCVNKWSPLVRARPYASSGPVPVLTSSAEIREFFTQLDQARVEELNADEREFVDAYYLERDAPEEIANIVKAGATNRLDGHETEVEAP